jgi:hypothetical protein
MTSMEADGRMVPGVSEEDTPGDKYHVVVTQQHFASWGWEIYRNGEPLPIPLRDGNYKSQRTAAAAGRVSIREFLEALEQVLKGERIEETGVS